MSSFTLLPDAGELRLDHLISEANSITRINKLYTFNTR